jgi:hypothetical protein
MCGTATPAQRYVSSEAYVYDEQCCRPPADSLHWWCRTICNALLSVTPLASVHWQHTTARAIATVDSHRAMAYRFASGRKDRACMAHVQQRQPLLGCSSPTGYQPLLYLLSLLGCPSTPPALRVSRCVHAPLHVRAHKLYECSECHTPLAARNAGCLKHPTTTSNGNYTSFTIPSSTCEFILPETVEQRVGNENQQVQVHRCSVCAM